MFVSLSENKSKKGDGDSRNAKTGALVVAAAKVAVGREGAGEALEKAANRGACHKAHKWSSIGEIANQNTPVKSGRVFLP